MFWAKRPSCAPPLAGQVVYGEALVPYDLVYVGVGAARGPKPKIAEDAGHRVVLLDGLPKLCYSPLSLSHRGMAKFGKRAPLKMAYLSV